jgi:hypothetical protein
MGGDDDDDHDKSVSKILPKMWHSPVEATDDGDNVNSDDDNDDVDDDNEESDGALAWLKKGGDVSSPARSPPRKIHENVIVTGGGAPHSPSRSHDSLRSSGGAAFVENVIRASLSTSPKREKVSDGASHVDTGNVVANDTNGNPDTASISSILQQVAALRQSQQAQFMSALLGGVKEPTALDEQAPALVSRPKLETIPSSGVHEITTSSSSSSAGTGGSPFSGVSLRVRLLGPWGGGKRVSLRFLRLVVSPLDPSSDLGSLDVDIERFFDVKVLQGLGQQLPPSSETAHNLKSLMLSDKRLALRCDPVWSGACSMQSPLELHLVGKAGISGEKSGIVHGCTDAIALSRLGNDGAESILSRMRLVLGNCLNADAAVRDIEVYVSDVCVFVGQMDKEYLSANVAIPLVSTKKQLQRSDDVAMLPVDRNEAAGDEEGLEPEWIKTLKPVKRPGSARFSEFNVHGSETIHPMDAGASVPEVSRSTQEQVSSERQSSPATKRDGVVLDTAGDVQTTPLSVNRRMQRRRRENRSKGGERIDDENDATLDRALRGGPSDENMMRQSIDAISHADRFNRGRLSRANLHADIDSSSFLLASAEKLVDNNTAMSPSVSPKEPLPLQTTPSESMREDVLSGSPIGSSEDRLKRSRRIEDVQDKVANALAGLADIMQDISLNKSGSKASIGGSGSLSNLHLNSSGGSPLVTTSRQPTPTVTTNSEIPISPQGRTLRLDVLSTWGDSHYIGFNGFDIFDDTGMRVVTVDMDMESLSKKERSCFSTATKIKSITGNPADINVLPEYENDPRHVSNLVDGVSFTRDDMHVWLAPLGYCTRGGENEEEIAPLASVSIEFTDPTTLSMIRLWNYNKSRTYSARGLRYCKLYLDEALVFCGEIRMGPGALTSAEAASEVILFTTDDMALQQIASHDEAMGYVVCYIIVLLSFLVCDVFISLSSPSIASCLPSMPRHESNHHPFPPLSIINQHYTHIPNYNTGTFLKTALRCGFRSYRESAVVPTVSVPLQRIVDQYPGGAKTAP